MLGKIQDLIIKQMAWKHLKHDVIFSSQYRFT